MAGEEVLERVWHREHGERDSVIARAIATHALSDSHTRPWGLKTAVFWFGSGATGTAIVAADSQPCGVVVPFPAELIAWRITVPYDAPAGSATFAVRLVQPGAAIASAALISTGGAPTLIGGTESLDETRGFWADTNIPARGYLVATLLTSSTLEVVELHLEMRAT